MKTRILLLLTALLFQQRFITAQSPGWNQAHAIGAGGYDFCRGIGTDQTGNIYIGGLFSNTVDFQPGPGVVYGASVAPTDFYIASYNGNGSIRWLRTMGGNGTSIDMGAFYADQAGNAYATGYFLGSIDFDGTSGTDIHTSATGAFDIFLTTYDQLGHYRFTLTLPGTSFFNMGKSITTDLSGNIYLSGYFSGSVDFDPGSGQSILNGVGLKDIFIAKYDSTGRFIWAKQIGGPDNETAFSLLVQDDKLYVTGGFEGTVDFNPGSGVSNYTSQGNADIFILKLDTAGHYNWNKRIGFTDNDEGHKITAGLNGALYITGFFGWQTDFDPGTGTATLSAAGADDVFILRLDTAGNFSWARSIGSTNSDEGLDIRTAANGDVYTYMMFRDATDIDPGSGTITFTPSTPGYSDLAIVCLDSTGTYKWAEQIGGDFNEYGGSMAVTANGGLWVSGDFFSPTISLGSLTISNIDPFGNANDIFFTRIGGSTQGMEDAEDEHPFEVYPNPSHGTFRIKGITGDQPIDLQVIDLQGRIVSSTRITPGLSPTIELKALKPGLFTLRWHQSGTVQQVPIMIIE